MNVVIYTLIVIQGHLLVTRILLSCSLCAVFSKTIFYQHCIYFEQIKCVRVELLIS